MAVTDSVPAEVPPVDQKTAFFAVLDGISGPTNKKPLKATPTIETVPLSVRMVPATVGTESLHSLLGNG